LRGEHNGVAKLATKDVQELRLLYTSGEWTQAELAKRYGINQQNVSSIINKRTWRHV
jgi:DNA-binding transcriptional regulator LsrR (DeoR family)